MDHIYNAIAGWFNFEQLYTQAVSEAQDGSVFVEIGCWLGKSTGFMAVEIINSGKKIEFYAVDSHNQDGGSIADDASYQEFVKNMAPVKDAVNIIRKKSTDFSLPFADFVYIDGDHSYEGVTADIEHWMPKIREGGILAGHDFDRMDVRKAVHGIIDNNRIKQKKNTWIVRM